MFRISETEKDPMSTTSQLPSDDQKLERSIRSALKKRKGKATTADIVVDTPIPTMEAERMLRSMISRYPCHLDVTEDGDLVYEFEPSMRTHDKRERRRIWLDKTRRRLWLGFSKFMKAMIAVVMVFYVVLFVALIIAAMVAAANRGGGRRSMRSSSRYGGGGGNFWFWYFVFGRPGGRYRSRGYRNPSYQRYGRPRVGKDERPFYQKVFSFVLGPEVQDIEAVVDESAMLHLIRSKQGTITTAELSAHTGWSLSKSEDTLTRLMGPYNGDITVTDESELVFSYPELMLTAGQKTRKGKLPLFWDRYERPLLLTGNQKGTDMLIGGLNLFNLIAAIAAPTTIMVSLAIPTTTAMMIALSWFPLTFAALVFAIPGLRSLWTKRENRRRAERNARRAVYQRLYEQAEESGTTRLLQSPADELASSNVPDWAAKAPMPENQWFQDVVTDLGGEAVISEDDPAADLSRLRQNLNAARKTRSLQKKAPESLQSVFNTRGEDNMLEAQIAAAAEEAASAVVH